MHPRPTRAGSSVALLDELETYYDRVPRATATAEVLGPFTLFLRRDADGWPFYARPRLGGQGPFTVGDVRRVQARQREAGAPEAFEWVAETTPDLGPVLRDAGLSVRDHPLMVLSEPSAFAVPAGLRVSVLSEDEPDDVLRAVTAAIGAGFGEVDEAGSTRPVDRLRASLALGLVRMAGAFDEADGTAVGGGSHSPRGEVSELTGIAVVPRCRGRGLGTAITAALVMDARALDVRTVFLSAGSRQVAELYGRVGFVRVGTACIAEAGS